VTSDELAIRTATADDFPALCDMLASAFADEFPDDDRERDRLVFEPARNLLVVDGETIVGNAGVYTREMTVPGGVTVPAAHVTMVGVSPTYRRRGALTRLMGRQLRDVRAVGEPLAALWASEGRIYQRYGYGLASTKLAFEIDGREVRLSERTSAAGVRLRDAAAADARKELAQVYERVRLTRPGWSSRDERWWEWNLEDPASRRHGATPKRALLAEGRDGVDGYALWRTKSSWRPTGPEGETQVAELVAATPDAYAALWRFLLSVDLTRAVRYGYAATDEPLVHLVNEPRRLGARYGDALWVRLVDVPDALAARRYAAPVDVVLEVNDALLPDNAGRWRLRAAGDDVTCTLSADPADLVCDVADLGAAYLGGVSLAALAAGGRVVERHPGALAAASAAFGWHRAPSALETF
jgi:predicted acetyltransferase